MTTEDELFAMASFMNASQSPSELIGELKKNAQEFEVVEAQYQKRRNELSEQTKKLNGELMGAYKKFAASDAVEVMGLSDAVRRMAERIGDKKRQEIVSIFRAIFKSTSSRTMVMYEKPKDASGFSVTVGQFGFGLRYHQMSKSIESYSQLVEFLKHKDEVLGEMKNHWHLRKWADKLELFIENMPDQTVCEDASVEVDLEEPVVIPEGGGDFATSRKLVLQLQNIGYRSNQNSVMHLVYDDGKGDGISSRHNSFTVRIGKADDAQQALVNLQLRDELLRRKDALQSKVQSIVDEAESKIQHLKELFVKDVMVADM